MTVLTENKTTAAQIEIEDLRSLLAGVADTTQRLESTHDALQKQVIQLKRELAEANAQLRRSRELAALGEMAAGIAHEIRNPLGSIQLYVQMLAEDVAQQKGPAELCQKIDRSVTMMDAIVRDVLLFSRNMKVSPVETSAQDLLERSIQSCDALIVGRDVHIDRDIDASLTLPADATLMTQALGNIIRNAIESTAEANRDKPSLEITATQRMLTDAHGKRRPHAVLSVADNGPGVPDEVVQRMFNPFFTTRATGTGLGLAIVHRIVDAHGGQINVRNADDQPGGAIFELCLPCSVEIQNNTQLQSKPQLQKQEVAL